MQRKGNLLDFRPSTQINIIEEFFTDKRFVKEHQLLFFKGFFRLGELITDMGNPVTVLKLIDNSIDVLLLEPILGTKEAKLLIAQHPHTIVLDHLKMPHNEIIPNYNCHGLCFGDSLYRIPDVTQILKDEYQECDEKDATHVVYFENTITVHSALISKGQFISKGGFRGMATYNSVKNAISQDIKFDKHIFYIKKQTSTLH